jgi:hypothetical protein
MFRILRQPYPFPESHRRAVWVSLAAGLFVGTFLNVFQPFGADDWDSPYKFWGLAGYGLVTTVVMLFNYFVLPRLAPGAFREETWTVGKEIAMSVWMFVSIGLGNYFYDAVLFGGEMQLGGLFGMIAVTFLIGIFPATGITVSNYVYWLRKYQQPPQPFLPPPAEVRADENQTVEFVAENERDRLVVPVADLFCIESSDNYSTVFFRQDGKLRKELIRSSLSRLEGQVSPDFIVRCHRSFVVNLHRVESVSGNAQGYRLHLDDFGLIVPVARRFTEPVVGRLRMTRRRV